MRTLDKLLKALSEDETITTYRTLEKAIDHRQDLKNAYEALLEKQKAMVKSEALGKPDFEEKKKAYDKALEALEKEPLIQQYLTLQKDINDDMSMLFEIIESGVNEEE